MEFSHRKDFTFTNILTENKKIMISHALNVPSKNILIFNHYRMDKKLKGVNIPGSRGGQGRKKKKNARKSVFFS